MKVGVQMVFQSYGYGPSMTDGQVVAEEVQLGVLADELGFDALWPVEHGGVAASLVAMGAGEYHCAGERNP